MYKTPSSRLGGVAALEPLEPRLLLSGSLVISEFLAINKNLPVDPANPDTTKWDWIEIYNPTAATVSLNNWKLRDGSNTWSFPTGKSINAGQYLVVYASGLNTIDGAGRMHTNFKLDGDPGEYLGLIAPDGQPAAEFAPYPKQVDDVSYGIGDPGLVSNTLVGEGIWVKYYVPPDSSLGLTWTGGTEPFNDSGWFGAETNVGYDLDPTYDGEIVTDIESFLYGQSSSIYLRIAFDVDDPSALQSLILRMKYDDGFVAYLNGQKIMERNAPASPAYDSAATGEHPDDQALVFEDLDVAAFKAYLQEGSNVLAVHGLNLAASDRDFLITAQLYADRWVDAPPEYYVTPTRGYANVQGAMGFVADTKFSVDRGYYTDPFSVVISCATAGAQIRYTLDGIAPTATTGTVYTGPVTINPAVTGAVSRLRAAAFKPGWVASDVDAQTYIFLGAWDAGQSKWVNGVLAQPSAPVGYPLNWGEFGADYEMDPNVVNSATYRDRIDDAMMAAPAVSVVMNFADLWGSGGQGIYLSGENSERACSLEFFYPTTGPEIPEGFQINCGIEIVGGTSTDRWKMDKLSLKVSFKDPWGPAKLDYALFGDDGTDSFDCLVLDARMNNSWAYGGGSDPVNQRLRAQYTRDQFVADLQRAAGGPSVRGFNVHLYLNGLYWGLYWLHERPDETFSSDYMGGDKDDYYVLKHNYTTVINPNPLYDPVGATAARNDYAHLLTDARAGLSNDAQYEHLKTHLDLNDFVDYMIINFYVGNTDWAHQNWYASRNFVDPDGRWRYYSWDAEHVMESVNQNVTGANNSGGPTEIHQLLCANAQYKQLFADRVQRLFFNGGILSPEGVKAIYQRRLDEVDLAVIGESARWGDNQEPESGITYTRDVHWLAQKSRLMDPYTPSNSESGYFDRRTAIVLAQLQGKGLYPATTTGAPVFSINGAYQHGGKVAAGGGLTMAKPSGTSGTIYYTLNGSDVCVWNTVTKTYDVSPTALVYSGSIDLLAVRGRVDVKARVKNGSVWSALNEAIYVLDDPLSASDTPPLRITEIMYNPAAPSELENALGYTSNTDFEYIELRNVGPKTLSLAGLSFARGVEFRFPAMDLAAGEYLIIARKPAAFKFRYPTVPAAKVLGPFRFQTLLDDAGERLQLVDPALDPLTSAVHDFKYKDGWFDHTDGGGFSLVVRSATQDLALWDSKDGWRASWQPGGNPAAADPGTANPGDIVINEILAHQDLDPPGDWIELHNTTDHAIAVGGWYLSDDSLTLMKYRIAAGTEIPAYGYIVLTEADNFGAASRDRGKLVAFALSELGDDVYLASAWQTGVGGYREDEHFGATDRGVTLGRYVKSTGTKDFVALTAPTYQTENADPLVGPIVFSEIMYNPQDGGDEFIELHNISSETVLLYDPDHPANTWQFTDGVTFVFPQGASMPGHTYALVVGIDPAAFRAKYAIPAEVQIFGAYCGSLANDGETVELSRPGVPEPPTPEFPDGFVPYIRAERVTYDDDAPWPCTPLGVSPPPPTSPDGGGPSLARIVSGDYGNDVANWTISLEIGGTPGAENWITPPQIVGIELNDRVGRSASAIEPSGIGVRSIDITFSEVVHFAAGAVTLRKVTFEGLTEVLGDVLPPLSVTGSGTDTMRIEFATAAVVDTWVKVVLNAAAVTDGSGAALDGEPRLNSSGLGYIYKAADDLPSGDGTPGGDAVFYVGSLRGDMQGGTFSAQTPEGRITVWDINGFTVRYLAANLDADMWGGTFMASTPDGVLTPWDINGFTIIYRAAVAAGRHLDTLPTGTGMLAVGGPVPLVLSEAAETPAPAVEPEPVPAPDTEETATVLATEENATEETAPELAAETLTLPAAETPVADEVDVLALAGEIPPSVAAPAAAAPADEAAPDLALPVAAAPEALYEATLTLAADDLAPAPEAWTAGAAAPASGPAPVEDDLVDLLALPALDVLAV